MCLDAELWLGIYVVLILFVDLLDHCRSTYRSLCGSLESHIRSMIMAATATLMPSAALPS